MARKNSASTQFQIGCATWYSILKAYRPINRGATNKSLAGIIEGNDSNAHWKTTTKESTKGCQAQARTISFSDGAKKRSILNSLICMSYFYSSSMESDPFGSDAGEIVGTLIRQPKPVP
jgi:hypothetical protein